MLEAIKVIDIDGIKGYQPLTKSKTDRTEYSGQVNLINWLKYNHDDIFYFATVNERNSSPGDMAKLKKQGLITGVPDLYLARAGKSLFIEMKTHNGTPSHFRESQREVALDITDSGHTVVVCFGFEAAKVAIKQFFELE